MFGWMIARAAKHPRTAYATLCGVSRTVVTVAAVWYVVTLHRGVAFKPVDACGVQIVDERVSGDTVQP